MRTSAAHILNTPLRALYKNVLLIPTGPFDWQEYTFKVKSKKYKLYLRISSLKYGKSVVQTTVDCRVPNNPRPGGQRPLER